MDKDYINRKIENCQGLVDTATSEDQKKVYQGYLDFWTEKLPKKDRPEEIAAKEDARIKKEAEAEAKRAEKQLIADQAEAAELARELEAKTKAERIAVKKAELAELEAEVGASVTVEDDLADTFELENPGKQAYRFQNGDKIKTIAFNEYLNQRTQ